MAASNELIHLEDAPTGGTHALVVGVGHYPYLAGGGKEVPEHGGMGQLSSPPVSARAFADWLLREYAFAARPLASVALLLSEPGRRRYANPRDGTTHTVPKATIENLVAAVKAWRVRAAGSAQNRLLFYFCGHGIAHGVDMALLAEDYNPADPNNPLDAALDFNGLRRGLRSSPAAEQLFFLDACRSTDAVLSDQDEQPYAGRVPLLYRRRPDDLPALRSTPYFATLAGERAFGRPDQVSLFTQALLRGLAGAGSTKSSGSWKVTTTQLAASIDDFMRRPVMAGTAALAQIPTANEVSDFEVHELAGDPRVPVYVSCLPPEDSLLADFSCRSGAAVVLSRPCGEVDPEQEGDGEWYLEVGPGDYHFEADLRDGRPRARDAFAWPPHLTVRLEAAP